MFLFFKVIKEYNKYVFFEFFFSKYFYYCMMYNVVLYIKFKLNYIVINLISS